MHVELRQQPRADEGADHADDEVADKSEAGALHDLPCEPAGNDADHHYKEKILTRHMHVRVLQLKLSAAIHQRPWNSLQRGAPRRCVHRRGALRNLAAVVPAPLALMPPTAARPFASPTPQICSALTRPVRPACDASFAAHVVPSAIVAAAVKGGYWRCDAFRYRPLSWRSKRAGDRGRSAESTRDEQG